MTIFVSIDSSLENNLWWNNLIHLYAREGDPFEIHCWYDEINLIHLAEQHGIKVRSSIPEVTVVSGKVTQELLDLLISGKKPEDTSGYNKMTPFYTVRIGENFSSEQYGTTVYLTCDSAEQYQQVDTLLQDMKHHANIYRNT